MNDELLTMAIDIADEAVDFIRASGPPKTITNKSSRSDLVTEVDKSTEALIRGLIEARRPSDSIIGEESDNLVGTSEVTWIVDPIDGTTNFVYGIPGCAVSIAVQRQGETVAAVVHDLGHDEQYTAIRRGGAYLNGSEITPSPTADIASALVGTGLSYDAARRVRQAQTLSNIAGQIRDIRRAGAASIDLCWVASGRLDAYYEQALWPWDYSAAELIVTEAGGVVGSIDTYSASRTLTIAANSHIFEEFRSLLVESLIFNEDEDRLD